MSKKVIKKSVKSLVKKQSTVKKLIIEPLNKSTSELSIESYNESNKEKSIKKKSIEEESIKKKSDNLASAAFENIDGEYVYGVLGTLKVVMMKSNGYINATKMCKDANKDFNHWLENISSKNLMIKVDRDLNYLQETEIIQILITVENGLNLTRGIYVHNYIIAYVASWCSTKHAVCVRNITKDYYLK